MWLRMYWAPVLVGLLCLLASREAGAQETREAAIASEQATRARQLSPDEPNRLERVFSIVEESGLPERIIEGFGGFFPRFGGLSPAAGFAVGAGYRHHLPREAMAQAGFTGSFRGYQLVDASLILPVTAHLSMVTRAAYRDYPQERFFGIGGGSLREDRTHYSIRGTDLSVGAAFQPVGSLRFAGSLGVVDWTVNRGEGGSPFIDDVFGSGHTPGLATQPLFLTWRASAQLDLRDVPANARAGGIYTLELTDHVDRDLDQFSFRRFVFDGVQHFPFFDKRRAIVLHARGVFANPRPGHQVPFFLMPTLGGPETLRGFREFRFRDAHMVLLSAEYRWEVFAALDMALFADGGTFASRASLLSIGDLKSSYGVGFRFSTIRKFLLRLDIGTGPEGTRFFARFIPAF